MSEHKPTAPPAGSADLPGGRSRPRGAWLIRLAPAILLLAVGAIMLAWTWGAWPDVQVDSGRELYIPWRLSQGDVLYRDVAFYNGPLSQYFNAGVFAVFGASLRVLEVSNLVWLMLLSACSYALLRPVGRWPAAAAVAVLLLIFSFCQYTHGGSYNYVLPYSHELTHGLTLLMLATLVLWRLEHRPKLSAALAGLCGGLIFLTKAELFIPAAMSLCGTLALVLWSLRATRRRWLAAVTCFLSAAVAPVLVSVVLLSLAMPAVAALRGTLGSWVPLMEPRLRELLFYRRTVGFDQPTDNLLTILRWLAGYAAVLAPAVVVGRLLRRGGVGTVGSAVLVAVATVGFLVMAGGGIYWLMAGRPWPVMLVALAAAQWIHLRKASPADRRRGALWLSLLILAAAPAGRLGLACQVWHYGFIFAAPAAMVLTAWMLGELPRWVDARGGSGLPVRLTGALVLALAVWAHIGYASRAVASKTAWVGSGADAFRADAVRGPAAARALAGIAQLAPPSDRLLVVPEGVMLNYLSRRASPTKYINFMPPEVVLFGEDRMLEAIWRDPPELLAMVPKSTDEYGLPGGFGRDYAHDLAVWLGAHYAPLFRVSSPPTDRGQFVITVAVRKDLAPRFNIPARPISAPATSAD